jgi:hypothetical protein
MTLVIIDRFGIDRLKTLCEQEMLNAIDIETAAHILFTADQHNADVSDSSLFSPDLCYFLFIIY